MSREWELHGRYLIRSRKIDFTVYTDVIVLAEESCVRIHKTQVDYKVDITTFALKID